MLIYFSPDLSEGTLHVQVDISFSLRKTSQS